LSPLVRLLGVGDVPRVGVVVVVDVVVDVRFPLVVVAVVGVVVA